MPAGPENETIRDLIRYMPLFTGVGLSVFTAATAVLRWHLVRSINEGLKKARLRDKEDEALWPNVTIAAGIQQERSNLSRMEWLWFQPRLPKDIDTHGIQQASSALLVACAPFSQAGKSWVSAAEEAFVKETDKAGRMEDFGRAKNIGEKLAKFPVEYTLNWVVRPVKASYEDDDRSFPEKLRPVFDARELFVQKVIKPAVKIAGLAMAGQVVRDRSSFGDNPFSRALTLYKLGVVDIQLQREQVEATLPVIKDGEYEAADIVTPGEPNLQFHPWYSTEAAAA